MDERLAELTKAFFTHPEKGGGFLSLKEMHELVNLQRAEIERLTRIVDRLPDCIDERD